MRPKNFEHPPSINGRAAVDLEYDLNNKTLRQ